MIHPWIKASKDLYSEFEKNVLFSLHEQMIRDYQLIVENKNEIIAQLVWKDNTSKLLLVKDSVYSDYANWIKFGLIEIIGNPGNREQQYTPSSDHRFLIRLSSYLKNFGYVTTIYYN